MDCGPWLSVFYPHFFSPKYDFTALPVCLGSFSYWKIKPVPIRHFPEEMAWWITFQHSCSHQFGQFCQHHWQKFSPKPWQTLQRVSLKAISTHFSISLQLFFSHIVEDWTQKKQTRICHSIILLLSVSKVSFSKAFSPCSPSEKVVYWLLLFHKDHSWSNFFRL